MVSYYDLSYVYHCFGIVFECWKLGAWGLEPINDFIVFIRGHSREFQWWIGPSWKLGSQGQCLSWPVVALCCLDRCAKNRRMIRMARPTQERFTRLGCSGSLLSVSVNQHIQHRHKKTCSVYDCSHGGSFKLWWSLTPWRSITWQFVLQKVPFARSDLKALVSMVSRPLQVTS